MAIIIQRDRWIDLSEPRQNRRMMMRRTLRWKNGKSYMSSLGIVGWLVSCIRADMAYAYSMIASANGKAGYQNNVETSDMGNEVPQGNINIWWSSVNALEQ
jgi:hypothetical protein